MQLISLANPVYVWPPNASLPLEAVALLGIVTTEETAHRVEVHGLFPPSGGLFTLRAPVILTLGRQSLATTQEVGPSAASPLPVV